MVGLHHQGEPLKIGTWIVVLVWALAFVQVLTIQPIQPSTFPEPLSWEQWALVAAFLVTSLGWLRNPRLRPVLGVHAALVVALIALHPFTAFGRDGSTVVFMVYLTIVIARVAVRRQWALLVASSCLALLAAETVIARLQAPGSEAGLPDYGSVMGEYDACGFLRHDLRTRVVGERGAATFITNHLGLRYDREVGEKKTSPGSRILFLGDSFVAGYRTDQSDTVGAHLERLLRQAPGQDVEVLPAGSGHPEASLRIAKTCGALLHPDLLLIGVTLGNDLAQSWLEKRRRSEAILDSLMLPADASKDPFALLPVKLLRSVRAWRLFRRLDAAVSTDVITPWFHDAPTRVHLFDPGHALGHFYVRRELEFISESYEATLESMSAIARAAEDSHARAVFVFFPQRFQVSTREWNATLFEYGLDPAMFNRDAPNRRLASGCRDAHLTCVDLLPAFRDLAVSERLYLPGGDMHWNSRGHAVAAQALAEVLR